ncbi:MAG: hypothetical protein IK151_01575 [Erysipelotrichaceae bacterium]|nr:hypothetical protein [Erysipelotrichaceae bacterium]
MKTLCKTSIFPASRDIVFAKLQQLETLQYIAAPYETFTPTDPDNLIWTVGSTTSYRFRLFGFIPFGTHTIHIERFDKDMVKSKEGNEHVPVWNHTIYLKENENGTEYTDKVEIDAGWKTPFIYLWAKAFYAHRQRKWIKILKATQL